MTSAADWSGAVGDIWAAEWRRTDRSFAGLSPHLDAAILAVAPERGSAVDLGCGAGTTSIALADRRPDLTITGVDISTELIRTATMHAAARPHLRFVAADVATEASFVARDADLLFSRHGVMFYNRPAAVFAALHETVAPDAPLIFSCFRAAALNPWAGALVAAVTGTAPIPPNGYAPGPFGFADPDWTAAMLAGAGWHVDPPQPVDCDYIAGAGDDPIGDAVVFFRRVGPVAAAIRAAPDADRPAMVDRLPDVLVEYRRDRHVVLPAGAWIWTAHA